MTDILKIPYDDRRIIVIGPKTILDVKDSTVDWKLATTLGIGGWAVLLVLVTIVGAPIVAPLAAAGGVASWLASKYKKSSGGGPEAKVQRSLSGVYAIDRDAAAEQLIFPPGHPILDHAYVGHPLVPRRYIPYAVFHSTLFEEKVNELVTLLASLGATRVRVVCRKGYRRGYGAQAGFEGPVDIGYLGADASAMKNVQQAAVFEEHFRPAGDVSIPDDLIWLGHEQSWQSLADRRLRFGTSKFQVSLRYVDDFGVNANLKAGLESVGFKLGGHFGQFESTQWDFEVEFA